MSDERLSSLVESIQHLNSTEYEEMFKLLYQNKCEYTRNNNGIFLNLSWIDKALLDKLELFVEFCKASRREIQHYESICKNLSLNIHEKQTHTGIDSENATKNSCEEDVVKKQTPMSLITLKNTSAVKFYLLKKKYAKHATFDMNLQRDLEKEHVLL